MLPWFSSLNILGQIQTAMHPFVKGMIVIKQIFL